MQVRLRNMRPFASIMTMTPAAAVSVRALAAMERHLQRGRERLNNAVSGFLRWLRSDTGHRATASDAQRRFMVLRLRFDAVVSQFDIFSNVLVQRSEQGTGQWIAGLDDLAADSLTLPRVTMERPPIVCYLDRGHGAAIRRVRARLPGGDLSPVAVIRVPRERMIGQGIGASLIHEVGHQAAALLDLLPGLRTTLQRQQRRYDPQQQVAWICWERWISEIIADLWAVSHLGISATLGLICVMSLPRRMVFQVDLGDPHPFPWIRVLVSCAIGQALYPHRCWARVQAMWEAMYPSEREAPETRALIDLLKTSLPHLAKVILGFRPARLTGRSLGSVLRDPSRSPDELRELWAQIRNVPDSFSRIRPTLLLAAISQARAEGKISPSHESRLLEAMLTRWAVSSALYGAEQCAALAARYEAPPSLAPAMLTYEPEPLRLRNARASHAFAGTNTRS